MVQSNQKTKKIPKIEVIKAEIQNVNPFIDQSNYEVLKGPKYTSKTKTKTATKSGLIMGIETLLNTISIALQNKRKRNQKGLNKQMASITPLFIKSKRP